MEYYKILDVVALVIDLTDLDLVKGRVGTIVEILDDNMVEVEFANKKGTTITTVPVAVKDLMLLHFETSKSK